MSQPTASSVAADRGLITSQAEVPDPTRCCVSRVRPSILSTPANGGWSYRCSTHHINRSINSDRFLHITYLNLKDIKMKWGRIIKAAHTLAQTEGHFLPHPEGRILLHPASNLKSRYGSIAYCPKKYTVRSWGLWFSFFFILCDYNDLRGGKKS